MKMPKTVEDIMTRDIIAFAPTSSVVTAARVLASQHIGGAPVVEEDGSPVGVVTLTDLVDPDRDRSDQDGQSLYYRIQNGTTEAVGTVTIDSPKEGVVDDVMSPYVFSVSPETQVVEAIRLMAADDVHRLMVVVGGKLVGIISSTDMLKAMAKVAEAESA